MTHHTETLNKRVSRQLFYQSEALTKLTANMIEVAQVYAALEEQKQINAELLRELKDLVVMVEAIPYTKHVLENAKSLIAQLED